MEVTLDRKSFRNTRWGLGIFGGLAIVLGLVCLLMVPLMLVGSMMQVPGRETMPLRMLIPAALIYLVIAVVDITLGAGSILCKRWAYRLMQLWSIYWLVAGISMALMAPFFLGDLNKTLTEGSQGAANLSPAFRYGLMFFLILFMGGIYILLPTVFTWFYSRRNTKAVCEERHPLTSWTDHCPLPVLGLSLLSFAMVLGLPVILIYAPIFPFFGHYLRGFLAIVLILGLSGVLAWSAWGLYHQQKKAWWAQLGVTLFLMLSYTLTLFQTGLMEMYRQLEMPAQTMKLLEANAFLQNKWIGLFGLLYFIPYLGLALYARKYFRGYEPDSTTS
jgi:hypothetical protein